MDGFNLDWYEDPARSDGGFSHEDTVRAVAEVRRLQGEVAALRQRDMCGTCYDLLGDEGRETAIAAAEARGRAAVEAEVHAALDAARFDRRQRHCPGRSWQERVQRLTTFLPPTAQTEQYADAAQAEVTP